MTPINETRWYRGMALKKNFGVVPKFLSCR